MKADLGEKPGALEFSGPDAVRFLNGQITQDVRKVMGTGLVLPSCVTDAKGRLQFRVWIAEGCGGVLVICREGMVEELEARLTRYLIADDVEVRDVSDKFRIEDFGIPEMDEAERIAKGIPKWGAELKEGMLPPEAGLDATDISYHKGCYIGQEVLSRIKTAGRLNRKLAAFLVDPGTEPGATLGTAGEGRPAGTITSVAPWPNEAGTHAALGYLDKSAFDEVELPVIGKPGVARILGFV